MFYAGRQQPGARGSTKHVAFQDISSFDVSMSFSEAMQFVHEESRGSIFSIVRLNFALWEAVCHAAVCFSSATQNASWR